jgi:cell division protein DivIC
MHRLLGFFRLLYSNFYAGTGFLFLVWITFFDGNDLISLFSNKMKLAETESEIEYYQAKIDAVIAEGQKLRGTPDAMEKFARERFLMKKDDEDIYLIKEVDHTSIFDRLVKE